MREIKFRAWDTIEKVMVTPKMITNPVCTDAPDAINCFILMQFTGLKDKNRVDVYEGDILMKSEGKPMTGRPPKNKIVGSVKKVVFEEGVFRLSKSLASKRYHLNSVAIWYYGFEVIGNIYEHPELLTP